MINLDINILFQILTSVRATPAKMEPSVTTRRMDSIAHARMDTQEDFANMVSKILICKYIYVYIYM